jgi:NADH:ubiquinone oxidoreductase subunit 3 (subunit A)
MIGAALGLIVLGIILLFLFPWAGIPLGIVGLILLVLFALGFGRRAASGRP